MKEIIRVNCETYEISRYQEPEEYRLLGGRGLISYILLNELNANINSLSKENKFILSGMLLSGTTISTVNRLSFGAKSPLTGGIKESNVGGTAGMYMAAHGIKAIIFENAPSDNALKTLVFTEEGNIRFDEAESLRGMGTYTTNEKLFEKYGENISTIMVGVAGERKYPNSSIQVSEFAIGYPCRAAARGGLGAVMASKGLKAIVFQKPKKPYKYDFIDKDKFMEASKAIAANILKNRTMLNNVGTVGFTAATVPTGMMPYRNFNGGLLTDEQREKFNVNKILERIKEYGGGTGHACQSGCVVQCSNQIKNKKGQHLTAGFEYETLGLFGPNCDIYDIEAIAKMDRFCDDFGFDTIDLAASVGVYMDAGKIEWGDADAVLELFDSFWEGGVVADEFGMGTEKLGKKYNVARIPTVKGQAIAAYDPRNLKGTGLTYALTPQGADHTCGSTLSRSDIDHSSAEPQVDVCLGAQKAQAASDSNACLLAWGSILGTGSAYADAVNAVFGTEWTTADVINMGSETIAREREFNRRAGFTRDDDRLPSFFYKEASDTGNVFDVSQKEIDEKWHHI